VTHELSHSQLAFNIFPEVAQPLLPILASAAAVSNQFGYTMHAVSSYNLWHALSDDGQRICDVVAQWNVQPLDAGDKHLHAVIQLWAPLAVLIAHGQWHCFGILGQSSFAKDCNAAILKVHAPHAVANDGDVFLPAHRPPADNAWGREGIDEGSLREMSEQLREWANIVLNGAPWDREAQLALFETSISWLDRQCDLLRPTTQEAFGRNGFQRRYKLDFMLQIFVLGNFFRDSSKLKECILRSLHVMLTPAMVAHYREIMDGEALHIPSAAAISRFRFAVDCAFMLTRRKFFNDSL
jgi:hypothetical protein